MRRRSKDEGLSINYRARKEDKEAKVEIVAHKLALNLFSCGLVEGMGGSAAVAPVGHPQQGQPTSRDLDGTMWPG